MVYMCVCVDYLAYFKVVAVDEAEDSVVFHRAGVAWVDYNGSLVGAIYNIGVLAKSVKAEVLYFKHC